VKVQVILKDNLDPDSTLSSITQVIESLTGKTVNGRIVRQTGTAKVGNGSV